MSWLSKLFGSKDASFSFGDLFSEPWVMSPARMQSLIATLAGTRFDRLADQREREEERNAARGKKPMSEEDDRPYQIQSGVAHLPIAGILVKSVPWWAEWLGIQMTSSVGAHRALIRALGDPEVRSILLRVDSPGGQISGIQALGDAIYGARSRKPISGHVEDIAASGGYWLVSQTQRVTAGRTSEIGSIGVYTALIDDSKAYANEGVEVKFIRSGEFKGVGHPGVEITDEQLKPEQEIVDQLCTIFVETVARGRGMSVEAARELATGRVWLGEDAQKLGLIDGIESVETAHGNMASAAVPLIADPGEDPTMANQNAPGASNPPPLPNNNPPPAASSAPAADSPEALRAERDSLKAQLEQRNKDACTAIIDNGMREGRVAPTQRPHLLKLAEAQGWDPNPLKEHVEATPKGTFTRAQPIGDTPRIDEPQTSNLGAAVESGLKAKGIDPAKAERAAQVVGVLPGNIAILASGKEVPLKDHLEGKGN